LPDPNPKIWLPQNLYQNLNKTGKSRRHSEKKYVDKRYVDKRYTDKK